MSADKETQLAILLSTGSSALDSILMAACLSREPRVFSEMQGSLKEAIGVKAEERATEIAVYHHLQRLRKRGVVSYRRDPLTGDRLYGLTLLGDERARHCAPFQLYGLSRYGAWLGISKGDDPLFYSSHLRFRILEELASGDAGPTALAHSLERDMKLVYLHLENLCEWGMVSKDPLSDGRVLQVGESHAVSLTEKGRECASRWVRPYREFFSGYSPEVVEEERKYADPEYRVQLSCAALLMERETAFSANRQSSQERRQTAEEFFRNRGSAVTLNEAARELGWRKDTAKKVLSGMVSSGILAVDKGVYALSNRA